MNNIVQVFKALGDETRLKITQMLLGRELCVCDIMAAFDKSQPVISHHLKTLKQAGLVKDVREGKWIYYSLNPEVFELVAVFVEGTKRLINEKARGRTCVHKEDVN